MGCRGKKMRGDNRESCLGGGQKFPTTVFSLRLMVEGGTAGSLVAAAAGRHQPSVPEGSKSSASSPPERHHLPNAYVFALFFLLSLRPTACVLLRHASTRSCLGGGRGGCSSSAHCRCIRGQPVRYGLVGVVDNQRKRGRECVFFMCRT